MDLDTLASLRLQIEWGADDALLEAPTDRFAAPPARIAPAPPRPAERLAPRPTPTLVPPAPAAAAPAAAATAAAAGAPDLAALHAALDAFDACPLRSTATTTVAPSGNPAAGLVLVAEAPGPDDDRAGHAFSGPAGARLDRVLASAGLARTDLLLTLMVPWRPPGGRPVSDAELALCLPFFHRLLALVRPRRLVLMGAGPYRALAGDDPGFRKARGTWRDIALPGLDRPIPALTILAPDIWLGTAASKQSIWTDLLTLRAALQTSRAEPKDIPP